MCRCGRRPPSMPCRMRTAPSTICETAGFRARRCWCREGSEFLGREAQGHEPFLEMLGHQVLGHEIVGDAAGADGPRLIEGARQLVRLERAAADPEQGEERRELVLVERREIARKLLIAAVEFVEAALVDGLPRQLLLRAAHMGVAVLEAFEG